MGIRSGLASADHQVFIKPLSHILDRMEGENIMEKLMGSDKDRDITFNEAILT